MKIEINIENKHMLILIGFITAIAALGLVIAAPPNPGHSWSEIECSDCITSGEIAQGAVGSGEIADSGVTSSKIADNAVTSNKIATDAVGSEEIKKDAVGKEELNEADVAADILTELTKIDGPDSGLDADTVDGLNTSNTEIWVCECNSDCGYGSYGTYLTDRNRDGELCEVHAYTCNVYFRNCEFLGYLLAPAS